MADINQIMSGLRIFDRLIPEDEDRSVSAEHDIIYAGPNPATVSNEDIIKLEHFGWHPENEHDCFYHFT